MKKAFSILFLAFSALFTPGLLYAQQTVGLFTKNTGQQNGYVLFSPNYSKITYLIDKCGKVVNKWNTGSEPGLDAYLLPSGDLLSTNRINDPYFSTAAGSGGGLLQILDWNGNLKWSYAISDSITHQDHDAYPMPNGNILVCEWERFTAAQAIAAGRNPASLKGVPLWMAKIQEIKPIGGGSDSVVWEWRMWDHLIQDFDSTKANYGVVADHPELLNINYEDPNAFTTTSDWNHINAVRYNPKLDQVMFSYRNISEIYIIDHSTSATEAAAHTGGNHNKGGDFLYRWGNPAAYNRGAKTDQRLFVQHNCSWIPDGYPGAGNITVFNDGTGRPAGNYSSADVIKPPVDSNGNYKLDSGKAYGPDTAYWSYVAPIPKSFYSAVEGGVQRLVNGNTLICASTTGNFFEVDSNKNIVWRYVNPDNGIVLQQGARAVNNTCFRAELYTEDYPAFSKKTLKPKDPVEINPYFYNCYMPFPIYPDPLFPISELKPYDPLTGVADSLNGGIGYIKGVVESGNIGSSNIQFSLIDSTGAITVATNTFSYTPAIGDSVLVGGVVIQVNGLTEYFADTILKLTNGTWQKKPDVVAKLSEASESDVITINNVWLTDTSEWLSKGEGFNVHITNGKDTFVMYINSNTDLSNMRLPFEEFNVTGIEIQNKSKSPFFGNYIIEPRGSFDIERVVQLYKIRQLRVQSAVTGVADSAGSINNFYLKGIVQSPDLSTSSLNFSIKDSTGSIIVVAASDVNGYTATIGDSIVLRGVLIQVNGLIEVNTDSISVLKNASPLLKPLIVSGLDEADEAQLVKLNGYYLADKSQWVPQGSGFSVNITNGADTFIMYISAATNLFNMSALNYPFNVTGIEIQDQSQSPYFGNYMIEPRGAFDIEGFPQLYKIRQVRVQDAITGIADSAGSIHSFLLKGIVQSPDFSTTGLNFSFEDSTGSIIIGASKDINGYIPNIGDSLELRGLLIQSAGLTEVVADSISVLKNALPVLKPGIVTGLTEPAEAQLIKLDGYYLADTTQWVPAGNGFDVNITNGVDTTIMHISSAVDLFNMSPLEGPFNVTGIEIQDQPDSPYFGGYEIEPRGLFDIERYTQLYKIRQVRGQNALTGVADSAGSIHPFFLKGIVQSPDFTASGYEFSIEDSTGSIFVEAVSALNSYSPAIEDSVEVRGFLTQVNGLTAVVIDSVSKLANPSPVLNPKIITSLSESTEANLVKYDNAWVVNPSQWVASGIGFSADITNGIDTVQLYISSATDAFAMAAPRGKFNVTGIGYQNKASAPYLGGYQLLPRDLADFQFLPPNLYKIREIKGNNPVSGIADSTNTYCLLKGIVQSGNLSGNNNEFYSLQDSTDAITVTSSTPVNGYSPVAGDSIEARGTVLQLNGLTHFAVDSISKLSTGMQISPVIITSLNENSESELVTMQGYRLVDSTKWDTTGANGSFEVKANNAVDTITLKIVSGTDLYSNAAMPRHSFDVTGIGSQDDLAAPYFSGYYLIPRSISDIAQSSGIEPYTLSGGRIELYPNPVSASVNITATFDITQIQVTDVAGRIICTQIPSAGKTCRVDLSSLKQGIYLVKVYNNENYGIARIVKD